MYNLSHISRDQKYQHNYIEIPTKNWCKEAYVSIGPHKSALRPSIGTIIYPYLTSDSSWISDLSLSFLYPLYWQSFHQVLVKRLKFEDSCKANFSKYAKNNVWQAVKSSFLVRFRQYELVPTSNNPVFIELNRLSFSLQAVQNIEDWNI